MRTFGVGAVRSMVVIDCAGPNKHPHSVSGPDPWRCGGSMVAAFPSTVIESLRVSDIGLR